MTNCIISEKNELDKYPTENNQLSEEWFKERVGKITASKFHCILDKLKNGSRSKEGINYIKEIAIERITKEKSQHFMSEAMKKGILNEDIARQSYTMETGNTVKLCGFINSTNIEMCGGSPDGLINDDGILEIKCPYNPINHFETLIEGIPEIYIPQIQGLLMITGRQYCDYVSYYQIYLTDVSNNDNNLSLIIKRVFRDDPYIDNLKKEIKKAFLEVEEYKNLILSMKKINSNANPPTMKDCNPL